MLRVFSVVRPAPFLLPQRSIPFLKNVRKREFGKNMPNVPTDRKYTFSHEWVKRMDADNSIIRVGITDFAQKELGDVVFVELIPEIGEDVKKGEPIALIESTKATGDVGSPFSGKIAGKNEKLSDDPGLLNSSPYEYGWLVDMEVDSGHMEEEFLSSEDYGKNASS